MTNRLSLNYFKGEINGVKQEKDDASLILLDQKKKLIYDKEDNIIMNMQNDEIRRQITLLDKNISEIKEKNTIQNFQIDQILKDLFIANEASKLFDKSITHLRKAVETERNCKVTLQAQVKELKKILIEEHAQKEEIKALVAIQQKNIHAIK